MVNNNLSVDINIEQFGNDFFKVTIVNKNGEFPLEDIENRDAFFKTLIEEHNKGKYLSIEFGHNIVPMFACSKNIQEVYFIGNGKEATTFEFLMSEDSK